jgi:hypothetical protein
MGIYVGGVAADMKNIDIYNNTVYSSSQGIAVAAESPSFRDSSGNLHRCEVLVIGCPIFNTYPGATYIDTHDIRIYNNRIYLNGNGNFINGTPKQGPGLILASHLKNIEVYHNTFSGNFRAFMINNNYSGYKSHHLAIRNNIFSNNGVGGQGVIGNVGSSVVFENNLFTGNSTYSVNLTIDPGVTPASNYCTLMGTNITGRCNTTNLANYNKLQTSVVYCNLTTNDYRPNTGSPAINAGFSIASTSPYKLDRLNANRSVAGNIADIGAFELSSPPCPLPVP